VINIIYIDNHPITRKGFKFIFKNSKEFKLVNTFKNHQEYQEFLDYKKIDVIIVSINIKEINAVNLMRKILTKSSADKILFFGEYTITQKLNCIKYGARGFVSKEASIKQLREAIYKSSKGEFYNSECSKQLTHENPTRPLSRREKEVLKHLFKGERNKSIATKLNIKPKTVNTYKTRALRKLKVTELIAAYALLKENS